VLEGDGVSGGNISVMVALEAAVREEGEGEWEESGMVVADDDARQAICWKSSKLNHTVVTGDDIEPSVEKKIQVPPKFLEFILYTGRNCIILVMIQVPPKFLEFILYTGRNCIILVMSFCVSTFAEYKSLDPA
jgi:hypothetical protein